MHFSKGDVDEALNHVGSYDVADIYIQKDFSVINDNNFRLLDRVFGKSADKGQSTADTDSGKVNAAADADGAGG